MSGIEFIQYNKTQTLRLDQYLGNVVMVVNTASRCGFAKQYADLEKLWQQYHNQGLIIIALPSNDFMGQEPGSDEEIIEFCEINFGVTFPIAAKLHVKGVDKHPFFNIVEQDLGKLALPKWNFYKYIINREGELVDWFASITKPTSRKIIDVVEAELAKGKNDKS